MWDTQIEPLFIPYSEFEEVFASLEGASDGQIKAQIYQEKDGTELYLANAGRFNVEAFMGWSNLEILIDKNKIISIPDFNHSQIQTLIGSIGIHRGYDIWIPNNDRNKLDWQLAQRFICKNHLPERYVRVFEVIKQVDVLWLIIQTDLLNDEHPSTIICPITTNVKNDIEILRVHLKRSQLDKQSDILVDQIRAVDNRRLLKKIGNLTKDRKRKIKR